MIWATCASVRGRRLGLPMWTNENRARYDRSKLRYPSDVSDEEWALVAPLIPLAGWAQHPLAIRRHACRGSGHSVLPRDTETAPTTDRLPDSQLCQPRKKPTLPLVSWSKQEGGSR